MDNENIKTCGEKKEQQSRTSAHTEKGPKYPFGILFFSLWWGMLDFTSDLIFYNARFKCVVQTNP
jgi:hypothetical protein